jgi:hypothetical protein
MEPSAEVKPYLKPYMDMAWGIGTKPYEGYQGQQIAGLNDYQNMGAGLTSAQALNGFQGQDDVMDNYQSMMRGDYLSPDSNPWLGAVANKAMGDISNNYMNSIKPQLDANFARSGAFGGSAWQEANNQGLQQLGDSLGNTANQFYATNYANERGNQMQGLGMAGAMQNLGYTDAQKLTGVGDAFRQYQQDLLNQGQANWNESQNYPYRQLDTIGNALRATMGAGSSQTTSNSGGYKPSPVASAIGGGMGGYALGDMFGMGGMGAGLGTLGGLLM